MVNTWPTSRWLGERIAAELGGVSANLRFPFPAARLRQLCEDVLAKEGLAGENHGNRPDAESAAADPWRASRLVWPLLDQLPAVAATPAGEPLRQWLAHRSGGHQLELATWQLGRAIADAFDDYALYRPELLGTWESGRSVDSRGAALPDSLLWQPLLYLALRERLAVEPTGLRMERAVERLRRRASPAAAAQADQPLRLFGLSSLAPVQVRLLQALSGHRAVELYLLTPCNDLWQRCHDRRRQLRDALQLPLDLEWLLAAPGLEARFGRLGAEFQQLLEGSGEAQLGEERSGELFFRPASRHPGGETAAPLLAQLQEQLGDPGGLRRLRRNEGDHSLEFHACPGPLRQVEIVRDRVLQLMAADPSLQPRDILVMTPQVDRFAPLVASVFGDGDATGVALPWRLTDRSQQSQAGIGRTLLALLRLGGERLTASALEAVFECRPLQQRFDLTPQEAGRLNGVLQRCGFRWGLDGAGRGGDPTHSLAWTIDRLLLGLVLPDQPGLALGSDAVATAPASGVDGLDLNGRWLHLLTRLRHWLAVLARPGDVSTWAERLRQLLADLFGDGGESAWELPPLLAAIDGWQEAAEHCPLSLEAPVVAAVLDEALAIDSGRFGHRSGSLTISALEPMRAIPHRVIVLMGLDAGDFPRQASRPGFHLMERQRLLGDPQPADQDRYVLLEALLSARDHLLISWSNRDDRSGETLPPAGPVRQWLQWLESELGFAMVADLRVEHPASPLERSNFQPRGGRPAASCDRRRLTTRRLLDGPQPDPPRGLALASPPAAGSLSGDEDRFTDLGDWLREPQRQWLRQLGVRPREWQELLDDLEAIELDERQRSTLLRRSLEGEEHGEAGDPADWQRRCRGRGLLPAAAGGELEARALASRWASLARNLAELGDAWQEPLEWQGWQAAPLWRGDTVVRVHTGRAVPGHRLELWLQLQLAAAASPHSGRRPGRGVLIAREGDELRSVLTLQAPEPDDGGTELERLSALREQWRDTCWPVPPRTGWNWLQAGGEEGGRGFAKGRGIWEGDGMQKAERREEVMVVCFGADLGAAALINDRFGTLAEALYGPMLLAEVKRKR
jgi:exodeoxyribonuclease V gamma subunit